MIPVKFPGVNVVFGEGQEQYQPLPAIKMPDGQVITCWQFSDEEIEIIKQTKCVYFNQLTFNRPLQPILPSVEITGGIETSL